MLSCANGRRSLQEASCQSTSCPYQQNHRSVHQLLLFTRNDRTYFAAAGIGDLFRYFVTARRHDNFEAAGAALFNLLEEVVIRRTRPFIRQFYQEATIKGRPVKWPERQLQTVRYDLERTYNGIYEKVVAGIEDLRLAHYSLESYKRTGIPRDEFEAGREQALVGIFKSRYLKRFESSIEAFRISIRRALAYVKTYEEFLLGGRVLDSRSFEKGIRFLAREDEEDDATPRSLGEELDENTEAHALLEKLPALNPAEYDLRSLHRDLSRDVEILTEIWTLIRDIKPEYDAKLAELKALLSGTLRDQKVLIFTYYRDTARYLTRELENAQAARWAAEMGNPYIRHLDSGTPTRERGRLIAAFSPKSNGRVDLVGTAEEVDIMISTDVLSEGQNLQDCAVLLNYDLHWNPTRMVQRAGRIDRIGSDHDIIWIYNMFPEAGLERLLGLVRRLNEKIQSIDRTGFMDASVLGEVVHPQNFNTLRRIEGEENSVIEEQERFLELASTEFLQQQLHSLLQSGARDTLEALPDGIHSGLYRSGNLGLFFYYTAPDVQQDRRRHFWRYFDANTGRILDNRLVITNLISCAPDTPRVLSDYDVFLVQDKVIEDILQSVQAQASVESAPAVLDPVQSTLIAVLSSYLTTSLASRAELRSIIAQLRKPATKPQVKRMKEAYTAFAADGTLEPLLASLRLLLVPSTESVVSAAASPILRREDLHLICFEHIVS